MGLYIYQEDCMQCCVYSSCSRICDIGYQAHNCQYQIYNNYYPQATPAYENYSMKYNPNTTNPLYYQMQDSQIQDPSCTNTGLSILANVCEDIQKTEQENEQDVPIDYSLKNKNKIHEEIQEVSSEASTSSTTSVQRRIMTCDHCGKTFTHKGDMNKHLRKHTGEQPFSCHICDRKFAHTSNLTRHLKVHSGDKPFSCDRCKKSFSRKDKLIMHQKTKLCLKSAYSSR